MTIKTTAELKAKFETGKTPTYQDFVDLVESQLHALLGNFPDPLPAVDGSQLLNIGAALPDPLPALDGSQLTNINPQEYNVPSGMPLPSYATVNTFVLTGDFTVGASDANNRVFLVGRRLRLRIAGTYEYTEVLSAGFTAGFTEVTTFDAMSGSPLEEVAVGVIRPFDQGGAVGPRIIGVSFELNIRLSNWFQHKTNKTFTLTSIAKGTVNGFPVAVAVGVADGTDAYLLVSDQRLTQWTEKANPKNFSLNAVVHRAGKFMAVGAADGTDAYIILGEDNFLSTWTEKANPKNFALNGLATNGTRIVAVGAADGTDAYILTTDDDGGSFIERANNAVNVGLLDVQFLNNQYVAVGGDFTNTRITTSPDGETWTERATPAGVRNLISVARNSTRIIAVGTDNSGNSGRMLYSDDDGATWAVGVLDGGQRLHSIINIGENFLIAAQHTSYGRVMLLSLDNGESFQSLSPPIIASGRFQELLNDNGTIFGVGSSDGTMALIANSLRI